MKTHGYCIAYRDGDEWKFVKETLYSCDRSTVVVVPTIEDALRYLASVYFDADTETQIVHVTVSGKFKQKENERET